MNTYVYPDENDLTTVTFIEKEKSWEQDELKLFSQAKRHIEPGGILVDAGCGFGRLIPVFADSFKKVIAVEPDKNRIQKAIEAVTAAGLIEKVTFLSVPIEQVRLEESANVVLSSHIIQHISTRTVPEVIHKMSEMLKTGGILILTTNHSPEDIDRYTKGYLENGKNREEVITQAEFEDLIGNRRGEIPVHMYAPESLRQILGSARFDVIEEHFFHSGPNYPDGRDVLLIARKR